MEVTARPFARWVALRSIGATYTWWRDQAVRLEAAGYDGVACWDHFISRGTKTDPVVECWTTLTGVAAVTTRLRVMPFVLNVMNRHPAVVARATATLQELAGGRLTIGIGIGGHPVEHHAYGMPYPEAAERVARLEEAVAVMRALWTGGPVTRPSPFYPLEAAHAYPVPDPVPAIIVGGETPAGARLAARVGDGWTSGAATFAERRALYEDTLAAVGRERSRMTVLVAFELGAGDSLAGSPWAEEPDAEVARWTERGADGAVIAARTTADVDLLVAAAERAGSVASTGPVGPWPGRSAGAGR
jgi:alkanesulfonate monooxygenase SsuD/methylene tetrahydromethanopterin reductase-like flavin-dependent oxidoreductase (luciferase family)